MGPNDEGILRVGQKRWGEAHLAVEGLGFLVVLEHGEEDANDACRTAFLHDFEQHARAKPTTTALTVDLQLPDVDRGHLRLLALLLDGVGDEAEKLVRVGLSVQYDMSVGVQCEVCSTVPEDD